MVARVFITKLEKAESQVQRGKPKGTLESGIRSAISVLQQRPPRYTSRGHLSKMMMFMTSAQVVQFCFSGGENGKAGACWG